MLKANRIFTTAPYAITAEFDRLLSLYGERFGIVSKSDTAAFFATLLAEVGTSANIKTENLNYSTSGLRKTFKFYRENPKLAYWHGRSSNHKADQIAIGSHAYANRMGNGDAKSMDGWKYRGRGGIQLTGKANYKRASEVILEVAGIDLNLVQFPDIAGTHTGAVLTALAFWKMNHLQGKSIDQVTDAVNRYTDSRQKRRMYYASIARLA